MYDDFDVYLGEKIKSLRIAKGMSIRQLAERINRSHTTLFDYERGKIPITANMLKDMCNILGVNYVDVLTSYRKKL